MDTALFYLLIAVSFINLSHLFMYLIGANIYDIKQFKKRSVRRPSQNRDALVTVVIPAHNEEEGIIRTLESVSKSTHTNLQIIVVDDASTDKTSKVVNEYIASNPEAPIEISRIILNRGKAVAMNYVIQDKAKGEFVMTLDADSVISRDSIENALHYFNDPNVAGVAANVKIYQAGTVVGLLQMFEHMIGYRSKKFYTLTNSEFIVGGVASTYRRDVLEKVGWYDTDTQTEDIGLSLKIAAEGNRTHKLVYAEDVLAMTEAVQTIPALFKQRYRWKLGMIQNLFKFRHVLAARDKEYTWMLTHFRMPMAFLGEILLLLEPVIFGYVIYLSILYIEPGFFFGAYTTIMVYLSFVVWNDDSLDIARRIKLSLYFPFMYFIFYIMNMVQFVAIIRCVRNPDKLLLKDGSTSSNWMSPERLKLVQKTA